jgi:hypothetical protein
MEATRLTPSLALFEVALNIRMVAASSRAALLPRHRPAPLLAPLLPALLRFQRWRHLLHVGPLTVLPRLEHQPSCSLTPPPLLVFGLLRPLVPIPPQLHQGNAAHRHPPFDLDKRPYSIAAEGQKGRSRQIPGSEKSLGEGQGIGEDPGRTAFWVEVESTG